MEGFVAADGGRSLKLGLLSFGALIWSAPLLAQAVPDPLAPLPSAPPPPDQAPPPPNVVPLPVVQQQPASPSKQTAKPPQVPLAQPTFATAAIPTDWRGV